MIRYDSIQHLHLVEEYHYIIAFIPRLHPLRHSLHTPTIMHFRPGLLVKLDCWNLEYWGRLSFLGWTWFARDELGREIRGCFEDIVVWLFLELNYLGVI